MSQKILIRKNYILKVKEDMQIDHEMKVKI